jgi:hypothetical protein
MSTDLLPVHSQTRLAHEITDTRYVGATSPDPLWGNTTCKYGFMSFDCADDQPKAAFELAK